MSEAVGMYDSIEAAIRRHPSSHHFYEAADAVIPTAEVRPLREAPETTTFCRRLGSTAISPSVSEMAPATEPYDPRIHEIRPAYPNMRFTFNERWVKGNGVVDATPTSRLRAVLKSLQEKGVEDVKQPDEIIDTQRKFRLMTRQSAGSKTGGITRGEILPPSQAIERAGTIMRLRNHPVWQALEQLENTYPDIPPTAMKALREQLIAVTSIDEIREMYKIAIRQYRAQTQESSHRF